MCIRVVQKWRRGEEEEENKDEEKVVNCEGGDRRMRME